ncbi:hypothetical protein [Gracilibacillus boraciitolerans]|nr:hypothetical protein [Gracilibacillus boraciitolerans]
MGGFSLQLTFPSKDRLEKWIFREKIPTGVNAGGLRYDITLQTK